MLHASALAFGWRSALLALVASHNAPRFQKPIGDVEAFMESSDQPDDDREPFHLDDTELAWRLGKDRGLVCFSTPPHAHLVFPTLPAR